MNPYAAPKAKLEEVAPAGTVWREGRLVRLERGAALPDRCVICNRHAGRRIARTLYWSPAAWRNSSAVAPFALLALGIAFEISLFVLLFWPLVIALAIVHFIVRKKLALHMPVCDYHRRLRNALRVLSIALMIALPLAIFNFPGGEATIQAGFAIAMLLLVLAVVQSLAGVQAISVRKLDAHHAWLGGTGRRFREALPELPG